MGKPNVLKWRFDVNTFRLIGRDLITDRITALFELVKNCYDANATEVKIVFENVGNICPNTFIRIVDNGVGMSFEDIRDKWMVIGTSNKRKNPYTPAPFNRKCVGEKGIGRFAVDKLGDKVEILTKQKDDRQWLSVRIDWSTYFNHNPDEGIKLFTDVDNEYSFRDDVSSEYSQGTSLLISDVREIWTEKDVKRLISEVGKLVSPFANISYPINIRIVALEYNIDTSAVRNIDDINLATVCFALDYNVFQRIQEYVEFNDEIHKMEIKTTALESFGGIKMRVYYFDELARKQYNKEFPQHKIDGIKIYRDGIITTPFAESEEHQDKKRDILGIDKRLWQDVFSRVSTREILGIVEITKEGNPDIIDATNRQDFVDNEQYRALKDFIIRQLDAIENYKRYATKLRKERKKTSMVSTEQNVSAIITSINNVVAQQPELKEELSTALEFLKKTDVVIKDAIQESEIAEAEFARKESIYMSIMSLQEYAIHVTHAVRTTLNKIRDRIEYFYMFFPDPSEEEIFKNYAHAMHNEFIAMNKVIDYMLSYSKSNLHPEDIELVATINEVFDSYKSQFDANGIVVEMFVPNELTLKNTNRQFFRDIFQNILDNSIKAMNGCVSKKIRCTISTNDGILFIKVSDTGCGIPKDKRKWVFGIYNTTTQEQGGAGIGLYIVKTRVDSMKGDVEIVDSEFGSEGTTIQIKLPLQK